MSTPTATTDLRPTLTASQRWAYSLILGTNPEQLDSPTPCAELTVRDLIAHMVGGTRRVAAMGAGRSALEVDAHPTDIGDESLADAYLAAMTQAQQAWQDEVAMTRELQAPWGTVSGARAVGGYLTEVLTHAWDLAVATGQAAEADGALAAIGLEQAMIKVPEGAREAIPFDPAVEPAEDAGLTEQLANWMGRRSRPNWVR